MEVNSTRKLCPTAYKDMRYLLPQRIGVQQLLLELSSFYRPGNLSTPGSFFGLLSNLCVGMLNFLVFVLLGCVNATRRLPQSYFQTRLGCLSPYHVICRSSEPARQTSSPGKTCQRYSHT